MWPFDVPVREALRLVGETAIVWAQFDAVWYRTRYREAVEAIPEPSDHAILEFYLTVGQGLGHSPNRYFDEAWHLRAYPNIAAKVAEGEFSSAFDAYCRTGNQDRAPHWLFDELDYRQRYPDLTNDVIVETGLVNGYDHYLRHGDREARVGHPMFDPAYYLVNLDPAEAAIAADIGPFEHYLRRLDEGPVSFDTTRNFDRHFYVSRYHAASRAPWRSALEHYLCNETPTLFDPLEDFSEDWYLASNPGFREAIKAGSYRNGYAHFLRHGARELRSPAPHIDLRWYSEQEPVREGLLAGETDDAFAHWLTIGKPNGYKAAPAPEDQIDDAQARALYRRKAAAMMPAYARAPLRFTSTGTPAIAAVLVVRDDLEASLATMASLRASTDADIELVPLVLGDAPLDRFVAGVTVQRLDRETDFLAAVSAGLGCVRSPVVTLLHDGVEIATGSIDAIPNRLQASMDIAAVGGKMLGARGVLRSAGHIVWRDGRVQPYLEGEPPSVPEANFVRDTHICGCEFIAFRTETLLALLDAGARPPVDDAAVADLCLRAIASGQRVVFDSAVVAWAWNDAIGSSPFVNTEDHAALLSGCRDSDTDSPNLARYADATQRRVLVIDDTIPVRNLGSGFVRSNDVIRTMAALGFGVTVFPVNGCRFDAARVYADMPDTVEIMHDRGVSRLEEFLRLRRGVYDAIWICRTHNMDRIRPILDRVFTEDTNGPKLILDTEAIGTLRDAAAAALGGQDFDITTRMRQEFASATPCRTVVAVNEIEAATLRDLGWDDVHVVGHQRPLNPTPRPFAERAGLLFVGAIHRMDSPNYDSLCWFVDEVLPRLEQSLRWETRLTIAGYVAPEVSLDRFANNPRVTLRGMVPDLTPLYASHRVFVAPTRFAAGAPYKVHEAASFGLPVVGTDLLQSQLGWVDGQEMLSAGVGDADTFANRIETLYRDPVLWDRIRTNALARLARDNDPAAYARAVEAVLGPARR